MPRIAGGRTRPDEQSKASDNPHDLTSGGAREPAPSSLDRAPTLRTNSEHPRRKRRVAEATSGRTSRPFSALRSRKQCRRLTAPRRRSRVPRSRPRVNAGRHDRRSPARDTARRCRRRTSRRSSSVVRRRRISPDRMGHGWPSCCHGRPDHCHGGAGFAGEGGRQDGVCAERRSERLAQLTRRQLEESRRPVLVPLNEPSHRPRTHGGMWVVPVRNIGDGPPWGFKRNTVMIGSRATRGGAAPSVRSRP
jgi:hypothetical protein